MTGLLIKDLKNIMTQGKVLGILFVFCFIFTVSTKNYAMLGGFMTVMCAMLPITALAYDERAQWEKYAMTMPVSKSDMVISKYLIGCISMAAVLIVNLILQFVMKTAPVSEILMLSLTFFGVGLTIISLILPVTFKMGVEKGRIISLLPVVLIFIFNKILTPGTISQTIGQIIDIGFRLFPVIAVLLLLISIQISISIYRKKEF